MHEPDSQKEKSSAYKAADDHILSGRSLTIMENEIGLIALPRGYRWWTVGSRTENNRHVLERNDLKETSG